MSTSRLLARTPSARRKALGRLNGYELRFHKRSSDGSGKADAFRTGRQGDIVWGVIFELSDAELPQLDEAEGVGHGYKRVQVDVKTSRGCLVPGAIVVTAWTYLAEATAIDPSLQPYSWYKRYVVDGAHEHALPLEYVMKLEAVPAIEDPDPHRAARNALT